jgi:hypothetical protein
VLSLSTKDVKDKSLDRDDNYIRLAEILGSKHMEAGAAVFLRHSLIGLELSHDNSSTFLSPLDLNTPGLFGPQFHNLSLKECLSWKSLDEPSSRLL